MDIWFFLGGNDGAGRSLTFVCVIELHLDQILTKLMLMDMCLILLEVYCSVCYHIGRCYHTVNFRTSFSAWRGAALMMTTPTISKQLLIHCVICGLLPVL